MTVEIPENAYYIRYCEERLNLPLYYCFKHSYHFDKGYYRCKEECTNGERFMRVFNDVKGTPLSIRYFNEHFKRPNKLKLFLHRHLWI